MTNTETSLPAQWVSAWYAAPSRLFAAGLQGRTLRQIVQVHAGGEQLRLRLSNRYGDAPLTLTSITVGRVLQGPLVVLGERPVRFAGQMTVTITPGHEVVSEPVPFPIAAQSDLAVTFFVAQGECVTGHLFAQQTSYVSAPGDVTAAPGEALLFAYPLQTTSWWGITGIDVLPTTPLNAVVAFGSSTTDGVGASLNINRRWPDELARRLQTAGGTRLMSVVNAGLGGNQLTSADIPLAGAAGLPPFLFGEAGTQRLVWDVLTQAGATDLIVHIGSNDLRLDVAGATVIAGLQQIARKAKATYRRVFATTILPGGYAPTQVEQWHVVNTWLREQEGQWFDAVFDFAAPVAAANDAALLDPACDSGDGIHPNDEGYRRMAAAVDLSLLTGSSSDTAGA